VNKKKVFFVITKSARGGAGRYVRDLAVAAQNTHAVSVIAGGEGPLFSELKKEGVHTLSISGLERNINLFKEVSAFFSLLTLFMREHPDTVHLNSPKAGGLGALAARVAGVPTIVYTAHGWAFYEDRSVVQRSIIKFFSWLIVLLSTKIIAVSKKDAHAFDGWMFVDNKIRYIPNGIAIETLKTKKDAQDELSSHGVSLEQPLIGTISELHKNKGIEYLIEAATEIPEATFIVIGEGEERKRLMLAIAAHKLENRFKLIGEIPQAAQLLPAFDIFVLPSTKEGLPYVLLEAGTASLPVVTTRIGGIPDIIEHEKNGLLIDSKDSHALARALRTLYTNPELAKKFSEALKKTVSENFNKNAMVQKTLALY